MSKRRSMPETAGYLAQLPGSVIGLGIITILAGVAILVWPGATVGAIGLVFGIFLLINGVFRLVSALASDERSGGSRALVALLGVVSILVGVLVLRHPFQTLAIMTLLLGLYWVISGLLETIHAVGSPGLSGRGWAVAAGLISLAAGIVVLVYPAVSLVVLVWLLGVQLVIGGAFVVALGIQIRRELRSAAPSVPQRRAPSEPRQAAADRHQTGQSSSG